jgi:hypothetical protein
VVLVPINKAHFFTMLKFYFFLIAIIFSTGIIAQTSLTGMILSNKDNRPVELASVYINGSSIGTSTGKDGSFKLEKVTFPCLLVVSRMSYQLKTIQLDHYPTTLLTIKIDEKITEIGEVSVAGKSLRKANEEMFKKYFLYGDENANMVKFQNLDVLYFAKRNDTIMTKATNLDYMAKALGKNLQWTTDSLSIVSYQDVFSTKTSSQLIIDIPKMGYKVSMDIDYFDVKTSQDKAEGTRIGWRCYSRSIPISPIVKNDKASIESYRRKAYFNSVRHFLQSLFANSLDQNGYLIPQSIPIRKAIYKTYYSSSGEPHDIFSRWTTPSYKSFLDFSSYLVKKTDNEVNIIGWKGKTIQILYFCKNNNEPVNLTNYKTFQSKYFDAKNISYMTFYNDTCRIYANGKSDGITFSGKMSLKPIGTIILPDDYKPE